MSLRFVLLSDHDLHARFLVAELVERGIALDAVLVQSAVMPAGTKGFQARLWPLRALLRFYKHHKAFYAPLRTRVIAGGAMNSARMERLLRNLAPDYLLVGSGSILKPNIIERAKSGVFNVHTGVLPWMRGSGTVGHALRCGVPVGATLHYIDAGVDTGALIERRLLPVTKKSQQLGELERETHQLAARLLADCVVDIARTGQKPPSTPQTARLPIFKWTDKEGRRPLNDLALAGRALELFEVWKPFTQGEPDWTLPDDLMDAPLPIEV